MYTPFKVFRRRNKVSGIVHGIPSDDANHTFCGKWWSRFAYVSEAEVVTCKSCLKRMRYELADMKKNEAQLVASMGKELPNETGLG